MKLVAAVPPAPVPNAFTKVPNAPDPPVVIPALSPLASKDEVELSPLEKRIAPDELFPAVVMLLPEPPSDRLAVFWPPPAAIRNAPDAFCPRVETALFEPLSRITAEFPFGPVPTSFTPAASLPAVATRLPDPLSSTVDVEEPPPENVKTPPAPVPVVVMALFTPLSVML